MMQTILEKIGLTEQQIESIQNNEIQRLLEQEKVLKAQVEKLARDTEDLYIKKRNTAEIAEALKLEVAENEKKANIKIGEAQKKERAVADREQAHLAREERFRLEKEQFVKDRGILANDLKEIEEKRESLLALEKDILKKQAKLNEDYDLLEDKRFYVDKKVEDLSRFEAEIKERQKDLNVKESELRKLEESVLAERSKLSDKAASDKARLEAEKAEAEEKLNEKEKEIVERLKSLKDRELLIVRKEKDLKNQELDIKARLESLEIKEAKYQEPKPEVKAEVKKKK